MRINEILNEYGLRRFGGFGKGYFQQRHYIYVANALSKISDPHAKEYLINWFSDAFARDSNKFKPDVFEKAATNGINVRVGPTFEQRHFYYLGHLVKSVSDPHIREFLVDWIAEKLGSTNFQFKQSVWEKYCTPALEAE